MSVTSVILYALIPSAAGILGAGAAVVRRPGRRLQSFIQHFAGGIVFAVVAVELLPDVTEARTVSAVVIGFTGGVLLMLALRALARRAEGGGVGSGTAVGPPREGAPGSVGMPSEDAGSGDVRETRGAGPSVSTALLVSIGIDILLDGLLLGIGFAVGAKEGVLLTIALTVELLSLALALIVRLLEGGAGRARAALLTSGLVLLMVPGAVAGDTILRGMGDHVMAGVLSFGAAALLYLVTEELLVEAHDVPETPVSTAMFFAGFLVFFVLELANR